MRKKVEHTALLTMFHTSKAVASILTCRDTALDGIGYKSALEIRKGAVNSRIAEEINQKSTLQKNERFTYSNQWRSIA